jgi:hypothetical protein
LRQARDSKPDNTLFETIAAISSSNPSIIKSLPRIFSSYIQAVRKYRGSLFGQGSNHPPGATIEGFNTSGTKFFAACHSLLDSVGSNAHTWSTRVALLSLVDQENIFTRKDLGASMVLNQNVDLSLQTLENGQNGKCHTTVLRKPN